VDLELAHVRSFLAVVDHGGYRRAAEALHLSQPAVSGHVRRLEAALGGALFRRDGRGVVPSERGVRAAEELRRVLAAHDRALVVLTRDDPTRAPFVLGTVEHAADAFLPEVLAGLRAAVAPRPVQLRVDRSRRLRDAVEDGEVDAAIVLEAPGLRADRLGRAPLRWYAAEGVRLDPPPDPLPLVAYSAPCAVRTLALELLGRAGLRAEVAAESPSMAGVHGAVRAGLGVALLSGGADGLRVLEEGPFAAPVVADLLLVGDAEGHALEAARRAVRRAAEAARRRASVRAG
jgi:DNA-binding transcriptional LysR family regulator